MKRQPKIVRRISSKCRLLTLTEQSGGSAHVGIRDPGADKPAWFWLTPARMRILHQSLGEILEKRNRDGGK